MLCTVTWEGAHGGLTLEEGCTLIALQGIPEEEEMDCVGGSQMANELLVEGWEETPPPPIPPPFLLTTLPNE